jgi:hypothetical protein
MSILGKICFTIFIFNWTLILGSIVDIGWCHVAFAVSVLMWVPVGLYVIWFNKIS